jgi:quinol monooxygenase YgiN
MRPFLAALCLLYCGASQGQIFNIEHFDVMPMAAGDVDFLQTGYGLLFKYRAQSRSDRGLLSFRILDLNPPITNHSEIVQVWDNYQDYQQHLSEAHTIAFRFDVQGSSRLGGLCCIGSPIDDRQYTLVRSFGTAWTRPAVPTTAGPARTLYVITYGEFLPGGDLRRSQAELLRYGEATRHFNTVDSVNYSVLEELHRPNRYAVLEIWTDEKHYRSWLASDVTRDFLTRLRPLLGSPLDHRLTALCADTFVNGKGCTSP